MKRIKFLLCLLFVLLRGFHGTAWSQSLDCDSFILNNLHPLQLQSPDFSDFSPLDSLVGQAKIVGLGEVISGSAEATQAKIRLVTYLIDSLGFNTLALEAGVAETHLLNQYLLTGEGTLKTLLRNLGDRMFMTQEMIDFLEGLRAYNEKNKAKVQVCGFDMKQYLQTLRILEEYANRYDADIYPEFGLIRNELSFEEKLRNYNKLLNRALLVQQAIKNNRNRLPLKTFDWYLHNSEVFIQHLSFMLDNQTAMYRDEFMAENINWLAEHVKDARIIIWSHNTHIDQMPFYAMGSFLHERHGDDYFTLGMAHYSGGYSGMDAEGNFSSDFKLEAPTDKTFEHYFNGFGHSSFLLNLKGADACKWLSGRLKFRDVDYLSGGKEFVKTELVSSFDALLFIEKSTPVLEIRQR